MARPNVTRSVEVRKEFARRADVGYQSGRSFRVRNEWTPVPQIVDGLDAAFYKAFKYVEPTNKRWLIGIGLRTF